MNSMISVVVGAVVAELLYWLGAVVALLATRGIPLGSPGGPPTRADIVTHVVIAGVAAFAGSSLAARMARRRRGSHAIATGGLLALLAVIAFGKTSSTWPGWFGIAIALAVIAGSLAAAVTVSRQAHETRSAL